MYFKYNVLILVLVEDGLGEFNEWKLKELDELVLILVLVEDGLGVLKKQEQRITFFTSSLNPCFGGRWSRRGSDT